MRSVLVTGASTGIGRTTALRLDAAGWKVYAGGRREEDGEALRAAASASLAPVTIDVNDTATTEIYTLSLTTSSDLGGRRIIRSDEHTSELQSHSHLVCRLLLEKKN